MIENPDGTMGLWFPLALMTAAAIFVVLWPLGRRHLAPTPGGERAVYRDQLFELERDRAAGLIGRTEAEAARVEVARRLLVADVAAQAPAGIAVPWRRRLSALAALIALPIVALGLYLVLGTPGLPDQPLAARIDAPLRSHAVATPSPSAAASVIPASNVVGVGERR